MNLDYQKVTEYKLSDLPLVMVNHDMIFGFVTSPNFQTVIDLQAMTAHGSEDAELIRLAALVLVYVQTPDGERYGLNTVESVEIFVEETDLEFLRSIIVSWFVLIFSKLQDHKKKQPQPLTRLNGSKKVQDPAGESLTS